MPSGYQTNDPILGSIDFDDKFVTDPWLIDQFVGNQLFMAGRNAAVISLGTGDIVDRSSPTQIGSLVNWKAITPGYGCTAAVKTDGTLWTWGYNPHGVLGQNDINVHRSSPVQVGALTNWKQVEVGVYHCLAVKYDGTLWAWGHNANGQLGLNDTVHRSSPVQVGSLTNWKLVTAGQYCSAAVKTDGTLWCWGQNAFAQLGLSDVTARSSPTQVGTLNNWRNVKNCGLSMSALKRDGSLWTWGYNHVGQLGLNDVTSRSSPTQVGTLTNWLSIGRTLYSGIATRLDGTLWVWGTSGNGEMGQSDLVHRSSPTQVGSLTNWKTVAWGCGNSNGAIKNDGTLWTWGAGGYGELATNTSISRSSPTQVGSLTNWKQVSFGPNVFGAVTFTEIS